MSNQQVTMGYGLSVLGGLFFALGVSELLSASSEDQALASNALLQLAGWFATVGWLVQRSEAGAFPFNHSASVVTAAKKIVSEICFPLTLLVLLLLSVLFLVGLMFTPFVLFVFEKLF